VGICDQAQRRRRAIEAAPQHGSQAHVSIDESPAIPIEDEAGI
jgi:hypothetical protein